MQVGIISFLAVHVATCLALKFLHKLAQNLFYKLMDTMMDALGITALLYWVECALKLLAATLIFLAGIRFGVHLCGCGNGGTGRLRLLLSQHPLQELLAFEK